MNKIALLLFILLSYISCKAQLPKVKDLSSNREMNYIINSIWCAKPVHRGLYNNSFFAYIFGMVDSRATPEGLFEGHEFIHSYLVSISPDGDYYTNSRLYKIEGLVNPKIIEIKESKYPKFIIKIEHGFYEKRKVKSFEFKGVE